ncbi:TetR/AcrR family transcriptional regulator [Leucobacter chromiireducens]|uniref:TetR/AcrR family transcriptional regulator n=1 Tax=Leucobacter chromiireducens subsp. solipictus TaxID=398235 RepID=A0ABS1SJG8_9MICO|nr:TetR/AcrR family transcriptional regulator [Leucobacter chromiireducens]MBL3680026.1 TetR/AcrR family transcriptional regulator [Leucobacter chromiireducens subsp. solipictus]
MPKIIDHDQRRKDIVDVTWQLIVEGGIEAATMREIATRAGFANGALKHYFSGKDQIIQGAYERSLNRIRDNLVKKVSGTRGIEAVELWMRNTLPIGAEDATAARVLLSCWERCAFSTELSGGYDEHLVSWKASYMTHLAEGRADGDIVTSTPDEQLVEEIVMMNIGATVVQVVSPNHLNERILDAQVSDFVARLGRAD